LARDRSSEWLRRYPRGQKPEVLVHHEHFPNVNSYDKRIAEVGTNTIGAPTGAEVGTNKIGAPTGNAVIGLQLKANEQVIIEDT
jgi:hypothetical protein